MNNIIKFLLIIITITVAIAGIIIISKKSSSSSDGEIISSPDSITREILAVKSNDNIKGSEKAPITIVNYSDYQCPYCVDYDKTLNQVLAAYPNEVKWVYRHFPLPSHPAAKEAAVAAEAAGAQSKYWEFHDKLVANSKPDGQGLSKEELIKYATELGLNIDLFNQNRTNQKLIDRVEVDIVDGSNLKIKGTPASYLIDKDGNIEQLEGALSFNQLKAKIDALLKR
ncbi:MAG: DSBA oxidoreductase family protein [Candidatus Berkelbacteria bacterium Athens1014_28]|uniref:DSBA oxidoreductase family protein n=1 Tax=Candidatus Berkelbacteria bacterium Athens1014_28 TaxID=2017145 RepID=A0A554LLS0_9BACT|nr:MAG: DSBA oxidoreductase family protein [Candidatus Berkelbacteria bacterium Athens1014_28]